MLGHDSLFDFCITQGEVNRLTSTNSALKEKTLTVYPDISNPCTYLKV